MTTNHACINTKEIETIVRHSFSKKVTKYAHTIGLSQFNIVIAGVVINYKPSMSVSDIVDLIKTQAKNNPVCGFTYTQKTYSPIMSIEHLADWWKNEYKVSKKELINANGGNPNLLLKINDIYLVPEGKYLPITILPEDKYEEFAKEIQKIWNYKEAKYIYAPGGSGYEEARKEFLSLSK